MGGRESKPYSLCYEDAVKRVSDAELGRLKSAYKRTATNGGTITCQAFSREVLGETVPQQLSKQIFAACGGTVKGISFKDLLCSLVLLTKGNTEEKIRFIFSIYSNETGSHILRADLLNHLLATEGADTSKKIVKQCMGQNERITYDEFREWLLKHQDATSITRWLLCTSTNTSASIAPPQDTPTFYQTLAGVTHLDESEILELEKSYWVLKGSSPSGRLDPSTLTPLLAPPLTPSLARGLFNAFDENRDQHIDFKEMACGISAACRGPLTERQKFLFKIFDRDRDGLLDRDELQGMVGALLALTMEEREDLWDSDGVCVGVEPERVNAVVESILMEHDPSNRGAIGQEDYLIWTLDNTLTHTLLTIIFQVCHIVLGLKPSSPREEGEIVMGWLHRAQSRPPTVGHFWYIVNMEWWSMWTEYVLGQGDGSSCSTPASTTSSLKRRTKLQLKTDNNTEGSVASDKNGVTVRSISSLSTLSLDDALSVGITDREPSTCWGGNVSRGSPSISSHIDQLSDVAPHKTQTFLGDDLNNYGPATSDYNRASSFTNNELNTHTNHQRIPSLSITMDGSLETGGTAHMNGSVASLASNKKAASSANLYIVGDSCRSSTCSTPSPSPLLTRRGGKGPCPRPPAIDNSPLVEPLPPQHKALQLTWEGGRLKRSVPLVQNRDFMLLPEALWKTLYSCYGGAPALPRQVIHGRRPGEVELELYPITVRILRHSQQSVQRPGTTAAGMVNTALPTAGVGGAATHWMGVMGGYGAAAISRIADSAPHYVSGLANSFNNGNSGSSSSKRYLAHMAAFSRLATLSQVYQYLGEKLRLNTDDMRLWIISGENLLLLEECVEETLESAGVSDLSDLLLEVRNKDLTWPEEMSQITSTTHSVRQNSIKTGAIEKGVTGLNNLGNTCFLNAAIQCCSNTAILTTYFLRNLHLYELNPSNPNGTKGHVAREYGNLLHQLWGGEARSVAPLKLRWTIGKWSGNFTGLDQHDSQELLAFLLDGLHEDLNRVQHKPYTELKDSEGRPDTLVAQEAWENHIVRNKSIIVDLFHGQLKSKVCCNECGHQSVRFDPFTYLTLQLPMESYTHVEVIVMTLDGSIPKKYGMRLIEDSTYKNIKKKLQEMTGILAHHLMLADLTYQPPQIKYIPMDDCRIRLTAGTVLYAYELPAPLHPTTCELKNKSSSVSSLRHSNKLINSDSYTSLAEYVRATRKITTTNEGEDKELNPEEQQRIKEVQLLQQKQHETGGVLNGNSGRSAKDRQMLAQIQRSTVNSSSTTSLLAISSEKMNGIEQRSSISPVPSPEPPYLQGESVNSDTSSKQQQFNQRRESNVSLTSTVSAPPTSTVATTYNSSFVPPVHTEADLSKTNKSFIIAYHRKLIRQEVYFLSSQKCRPSLFGLPLVVACSEGSTHKSLYERVWRQVSRLVTPLPPSEAAAGTNHAADCDDSLGYEFPFVLRMVEKEGLQCAVCPWYHFCRGCQLNCDDTSFPAHTVAFLAIDWDPTALHLRYQSTLERSVSEDMSVAEERLRHTEPISLQHCLEAFTSEETLDYSCQHCKKCHPASKKLQIWRLPPLLIVHLKRFQFVGQKWIKSQKIVQFPLRDFDPTEYLASVPRETIALHQAQMEGRLNKDGLLEHSSLPLLPENKVINGVVSATMEHNSLPPLQPATEVTSFSDYSSDEDYNDKDNKSPNNNMTPPMAKIRAKNKRRVRNGSVLYGDTLQDFHQHRLKEGSDPLTLSYDLYAIACHTGVMEAGHYVCYAKNPQGKWICFNDSSCKEVSEQEIDLESAYLLFYERKGLDASQYLPNVSGRSPQPMTQLDSEVEAEYKKQCSVM